jgi:hypothetical protein
LATTASAKKNPPPVVSIGAGVGGLALGLLVGILSAYCIMRRKGQKLQEEFDKSRVVEVASTTVLARDRPMSTSSRPTLSYMDGSNASATNVPINRKGRIAPSQYQVEALVLPGEGARHTSPSAPETVASQSEIGHSTTSNQERVYVVHHDSGRPPVTVYTGSGTEVVELPPSYLANSSQQRPRTSSGPSGARPNLSQRRVVAPVQKKTLEESQTYTREPPT